MIHDIFIPSTGRPTTPTLTSNNNNPVDGDSVTLSCQTTSSGVTQYEFRRNGFSLTTSVINTLVISTATIGVDDGSYTCITYINDILSDESNAYFLACEFFLCFFLFLFWLYEHPIFMLYINLQSLKYIQQSNSTSQEYHN